MPHSSPTGPGPCGRSVRTFQSPLSPSSSPAPLRQDGPSIGSCTLPETRDAIIGSTGSRRRAHAGDWAGWPCLPSGHHLPTASANGIPARSRRAKGDVDTLPDLLRRRTTFAVLLARLVSSSAGNSHPSALPSAFDPAGSNRRKEVPLARNADAARSSDAPGRHVTGGFKPRGPVNNRHPFSHYGDLPA